MFSQNFIKNDSDQHSTISLTTCRIAVQVSVLSEAENNHLVFNCPGNMNNNDDKIQCIFAFIFCYETVNVNAYTFR